MSSPHDAALRRQSHPDAYAPGTPSGSRPWPIRYATQSADLEAALFAPALDRVGRPSANTLTAGKIVFPTSGGPIRTIVTGRRHIVTGSYASRKARRAMPFEGMNERLFFMHSEVDTSVVDYRAQPFRFEFTIDGVGRTYIVDCVRLLSDGRIEVVEVKNDRRALRDDHYLEKLGQVAATCTGLGWDFRVVLREELENPRARLGNIELIQSRRHTRFTSADVYVALESIEQAGGRISMGKLAEELGDVHRGRAILQAMMVHRLVEIDLSKPLGSETSVSIPSSPTAVSLRGGAGR